MKDFDFYLNKFGEVGEVTQTSSSLVAVNGLPLVSSSEVVIFENGEIGQVLLLGENDMQVLTFSSSPIRVQTKVARTGKRISVSVGDVYLGKIIDPFCKSLNRDVLPKEGEASLPIDIGPLGIAYRTELTKPLETGVGMVDILCPLGCGQRELIIGERKTGKTSFLLQTTLYQASRGTICIYAAVGKRRSDVKKTEEYLFKNKALRKNITIIATLPQDPLGTIYLTPFAAMSMAEYYCQQGRDVLLVIDDLTVHAKICREISLLAKRFPGRDSYPVDIFSIHARLLERGGNFLVEGKAVALTALPVAEATKGELGGYIETNLMSMTDGHIYFDSELYARGRRPAVNPYLSVTRVGQQVQLPARREMSREIRSFLTKYEQAKSLVHFGAELTDNIKKILAKGDSIVNLLDQGESTLSAPNLQMLLVGYMWKAYSEDKKDFIAVDVLKRKIDEMNKKYSEDKKFQEEANEIADTAESFEGYLEKIEKIIN